MAELQNRPPCSPVLGADVFIADTAYVCGDVHLGNGCSVWPGSVIRGDISPIRIGERVNVQDGTIIHTKHSVPLDIADDVGFGHRAVVHCRRIGRRSLIGIGAVILDDCEIGEGCLIAAGTVLTPGTHVPDGMLALGVPGRVVRPLKPEEEAYLEHASRMARQLVARRWLLEEDVDAVLERARRTWDWIVNRP